MSNISLKEWSKYRTTLALLSQLASDEFRDHFLKKPNGLSDVSINEVIDYAFALVTKYGEGSAELACQMYDDLARLSGVNVPSAIPAETATISETAKAINGVLKMSPSGQLIDSAIQRLVKQPAADTTLLNAKRDGAQFAWIPSGDTCAFCLTLASRGWQYASKTTLKNGHAEHIHGHCDCQYAVRFNQNTNVAGYDPQKYKDMYYAESGKPQDRINAMRRKMYAENREEINERKREAYAKRKGEQQ